MRSYKQLAGILPSHITPIRATLFYAVFAALWIIASGYLLAFSTHDALLQNRIEIAKGLLFVALTSGLLYLLVKHLLESAGHPITQEATQPVGKFRLGPVLITLLLVVPLIDLAIVKFHGPKVEEDAYANLESIARLKADQIESWLAERNNDAHAIMADDDMAARVDKFVYMQHYGILSQPILDRFQNLRTAYGYNSILLFEGSGRLLLMLGEEADNAPALQEQIRLALLTKQVQRGDLYRDPDGNIHLDWIVPIVIRNQKEDRAMAAVVLRTTAQDYLFPLIKTWPTTSPSAETQLVRREGDSVVFLNELRHNKQPPLTLKHPLSDAAMPASIALRSDKPGITPGVDYRGVPLMAAYRPIAGTGWEIIAQIDHNEVMEPLSQLVRWVSLITCAAIIAIGTVLLMLWRQQQRMQSLALLGQKAEANRLLQYFFDLPFIGMAISSPTTKNWLQLNDRLCSMLGYTRAELAGKNWMEMTHPDDIEVSIDRFEAVMRGEIEAYSQEKRFIRKNGEILFAAVDVKCVRKPEGAVDFLVATIEDITERKANERQVQRLTQLYATLSQCNQTIVRSVNMAELFPQICHAAVQFGGMKMAWIGLVDQETQWVKPVASYGEGTEYLQDLKISADGGNLYGQGLTGIAIRENRPSWCQDFQTDPLAATWRERATQNGMKAMAALPLTRGGVVIGVFNLYADEVNAFDKAVRNLLVEMMTDISFALDHFALEADRKQIMLTLEKNEAHLRTLVKSIPDLIWLKDAEGVYLSCNPTFEQFFGAKEADIVGKTDYDFVDETQANFFREHDRRAMLAGKPSVNEEWLTFEQDGRRRLFETIKTPILDTEQKLIGVLGIGRDITERKQAEQELRVAATAFETKEAMTITDANKVILKVNKAFTQITGYSAEEAIGQTPAMLKSGRQDQLFYQGMWETLARDRFWQGEIWNRRKNGEIFPEWLSISAVADEHGQITHYVGSFSDITQFLETERALRDSETRFRVIANSTVNWEVWWGTDGSVQWMNPATEQIIGYSVGECLAMNDLIMTIVYQEDLSIAQEVISSGLQGLGGENAEFRCICKDGSRIWMSLSWQPIEDADGHSLGFRTTARDITERKQAVDTLRLTRIGVEASSDALLWITPEAHIIDVNAAACRTLGYSREELLKLSMPDIDMRYDQRSWSQHFNALRQRHSMTFESEHRAKDGRLIPVEVVANYVQFNNEERNCAFIRDITERKRAKADLEKLNAELENKVALRTRDLELANATLAIKEKEIRSVVEYMTDCVITINHSGIIRSANAVIEKLFGYTPVEVIGQNISMLMPEPNRSAHDGYLKQYCGGADPRIIGMQREVEGLHRDGTRIPLELAVSEYFVGDTRFFTGILRDISARQRTLQTLERARAEAEQANRAKSAFLATMSHEIRTPMNGVIGMIDVLQQSALKGPQVEMVDLIHNSAFSLLGIIDDILDFSKIEAGRVHIEKVPMDLMRVAEGVCETLDPVAMKKGVELQLFVDPAIPVFILGDAGRLRQVLINLVSNAIKFASDQSQPGQVSLRATLAEQGSQQIKVMFQVADNGIGMDTATQAGLFTPFTQADTSTTRRFGGTGLGLAISRQLVVLMNGTIELQSALNKGSLFSLCIPFAVSPETPPVASIPVKNLHCLMVGGRDEMINDLGAYLMHAGAKVKHLEDGVTAAKWLKRYPRGLWIIIHSASNTLDVDSLRNAASARPQLDARFVVIGRGVRRRGRLEASGITVLDGHPIYCKAFLNAVAMAAGRIKDDKREISDKNAEAISRPLSAKEARQQGRVVLVAEDNEINQKVIRHQLALLSFAADIGVNGHMALELWRNGHYALLLTDLRMPEMDGYELTASIRAAEAGQTRIPIIALTANALKGEAEHCFAAGMDDYLTKPVQLPQLQAVLEKWLLLGASSPIAPAASRTVAKVVVDLQVLKDLVGDDAALIQQLLQDFRASAAAIAGELHAARSADRAVMVGTAAHKLKSSARAVGALKLGEICAELEQAGLKGDNEAMVKLMLMLDQEMAAVDEYLGSLPPEDVMKT